MACDLCGFEPCRCCVPPLLLHIPKNTLTPEQRKELRNVYVADESLGPVAMMYSALVKAATTGDRAKLAGALKDLKDAVVWAEGEIKKT